MDIRQCSVGIPLVELGEKVTLLGEHLKEGIMPLQGQKTWLVPLSDHSTTGYTGVCRGQIKWLQLFTVFHHKLQVPVWPCNGFSETEQCQAQCCRDLLWRVEWVHVHKATMRIEEAKDRIGDMEDTIMENNEAEKRGNGNY